MRQKLENLWYSKWRTQGHENEARLILGHENEARQPTYPISLLEDHVVARILFLRRPAAYIAMALMCLIRFQEKPKTRTK